MKKKRPDFWSYFKSLFKSEIEVKCKNGKRYYKHDLKARLIVNGIFATIVILNIFLDYSNQEFRFTLSYTLLGVYALISIPLTYYFAKFEETKDEKNNKKE